MEEVPGLSGVVASGDRRASLESLRDFLARALEDADVRSQAPLAGRLQDVLRELDSLPEVKGGSQLDDLRARRRGRSASAG